MYLFLAVFMIIAGICFFSFANLITKNSTTVIAIKIIGISLIIIGISMSYLLFSGKIVLPLSKN